MQIKTAEQIAKECEHLNGIAEKRAINNLYRLQDQSNLYPIFNKFDATERAIRRVRKFIKKSGCDSGGLEYCYMIENAISEIVNNEN